MGQRADETWHGTWAGSSDTGMSATEIHERVQGKASISTAPCGTSGKGGESVPRFNFGTQRACMAEAVSRHHDAFADLRWRRPSTAGRARTTRPSNLCACTIPARRHHQSGTPSKTDQPFAARSSKQ